MIRLNVLVVNRKLSCFFFVKLSFLMVVEIIVGKYFVLFVVGVV